MPNPKNNAKMTGDLHLPDVESDLPLQEATTGTPGPDGTPGGRASESDASRPSRGVRKAGLLRDEDDSAPDGDA
ncbi:MAG: hypothetical protein JWQ72_3415 [Polaromonas sp.]|nr:hypothetical protein [Polaromonas sp.]